MTDEKRLIDGEVAARTPVAVIGGKARQLGELVRYGLPVPDFFVVPVAWSHDRGRGVPRALAVLLEQALEARGWQDLPLAVRSSAIGEDEGSASFAGVYRSHLNIRGISGLTAAIANIWASLDSQVAMAYRQGLGLVGELGMAVVVMPLLPALASGIGFTCDPVSGREDRLVIHAHWGLGEALVGGEAAGDDYLLAEDASDVWRLIEVRIGSKATLALPAEAGGTERRPATPVEAAAQVLDDGQVEALAALLRDAALAFDFVAPFFDLEWVWDGHRFWLTQIRPVTRRPHHTYPALRGKPAIWTRGNTCEIMPEPLQAMDWNFSRRGCNHLLEQGWRLAGYPVLPGVQRAGLIDGRLYLEASIMQWEAWDAIGLAPARFNALMGGHQPTIETEAPGWRERLKRLGRTLAYLRRAPAMARRGDAEIAQAHALSRELREVPLPEGQEELVALLYRLLKPARESRGMFFLQGSSGGSLSLLLETLEHYFPGEGAAVGAALLAGGEPSVTAKQGYDLLALASLWKLAKNSGRPQDDAEFATALAAFLDGHGHRGHYETYLRSPRWIEQPELLLQQLPALAEVDLAAMRARQQEAGAAAWARIRRRVPWWARPMLRAQVRAANRDSNRREAARSAMIALLAPARRLWLLIGERLTGEGALASADEIFHCLPSELLRHAQGALPAPGLRARVVGRKALFARWQATEPADWLTLSAAGEAARPNGGTVEAVGGDCLRGVATGTGLARGRVRRLRHPAEGGALRAGEILVAPSTDPGWTPLFLKAAGLVVETGGYLSHGAIVAREFGLPAVVNLPGVLGLLNDGDLVEVDGLRGEVRRLECVAAGQHDSRSCIQVS